MTNTITTKDFYTERDDYGRTVYATSSLTGVAVKMPKTWTATRPEEAYLVNLRLPFKSLEEMHEGVSSHATKAEALAFIIANSPTR